MEQNQQQQQHLYKMKVTHFEESVSHFSDYSRSSFVLLFRVDKMTSMTVIGSFNQYSTDFIGAGREQL